MTEHTVKRFLLLNIRPGKFFRGFQVDPIAKGDAGFMFQSLSWVEVEMKKFSHLMKNIHIALICRL